jgi:hypothetical protein
MSSSKGSGWPGGGPFATWRTIVMISCTISPRTPPVALLSKWRAAALIVTLASSSLAKSQSTSPDMTTRRCVMYSRVQEENDRALLLRTAPIDYDTALA